MAAPNAASSPVIKVENDDSSYELADVMTTKNPPAVVPKHGTKSSSPSMTPSGQSTKTALPIRTQTRTDVDNGNHSDVPSTMSGPPLQQVLQRLDALEKNVETLRTGTVKSLQAVCNHLERRKKRSQSQFEFLNDRFNELQKTVRDGFESIKPKLDDRWNESLNNLRKHFHDRYDATESMLSEEFDEIKEGIAKADRHLKRYGIKLARHVSKHANKKAIAFDNEIEEISRDDGCFVPEELYPHLQHVHDFLCLQNRDQWPALAELLEFYQCESWPDWGSKPPMLGGYRTGIPFKKHATLAAAIEAEPELALQELAHRLGLDYTKIMDYLNARKQQQQDVQGAEDRPAKRQRVVHTFDD